MEREADLTIGFVYECLSEKGRDQLNELVRSSSIALASGADLQDFINSNPLIKKEWSEILKKNKGLAKELKKKRKKK